MPSLATLSCAALMAGWCSVCFASSLPSQLIIEHRFWRVVEVKKLVVDGDKLDGFTNCVAQQITIRKRDADEQAETLLHEMLHALTCEHGQIHNDSWNNQGNAHPGIYRMTPRLYRVLVNNPELLRFIRESDDPEEVPAAEAEN